MMPWRTEGMGEGGGGGGTLGENWATHVQFLRLYVVPISTRCYNMWRFLQAGNQPTRVEQQHWMVYTCTTAEILQESNLIQSNRI